jgi:hypothetical protein
MEINFEIGVVVVEVIHMPVSGPIEAVGPGTFSILCAIL